MQGREEARLNPTDARELNICDGHTIRLWNDRGACLATAAISSSVRRGVVVLPTGSWFTPAADGVDISGNPNSLTPDIPTSRFGQGCSAHTCLVSVEPLGETGQDAEAHYAMELAGLTKSSNW